ncbi:uncharacterized protein LOC142895745 isoform X5 [Nelusetta ayraudi]|uniref:uncharacterized protein LOC142895745 isoform X5 n=1 Tax=Nelusetta ayraudi TaxID=303726 RepID=UPI003F72FC1C
MAKCLLFVILMYFPCKTQCEEPSPQLTVHPPVISAETQSVTLNCQPPSSAPVPQCYLVIEGVHSVQSSSCWETLTGSELLVKSGQSSPAEVKVKCSYTVRKGDVYSHSSYSNMVSIYIQNPPPQLTLYPPVISAETLSVTLNCHPPSSAPVAQCYFIIEGGESVQSSSCWETLTGSELLVKSGQSSPAEVKVKCFYAVRNRDVYFHSSYSNMVSIYIQNPPPQLTLYPPVISAETHSVTLNCHPPSSAPVPQCYFIIEGGESVQSSSCWETLTGSELLVKSGQSSPAEIKVKCFYAVRKGDVFSPSSHSSTQSMYIQSPVEAAPTLTVNPRTISETESVTLRCQPPPSVSAPQCYFYIVKGGAPKLLSCVETLRGSELLLMSQQSSPAQVEVKCFYTVKLGHLDYPSAHSDAQVMMIDSGPPQLSVHHSPGRDVVFTCSLPGSAIKDTTCNLYFGDATVQRAKLSYRSRMDNKWFCQFYVSINDLLRLSPQQSHASCDYSLKGDPNTLSPRSERYNLAVIVEKESRRAPTEPSLTQTTIKTSSTAKVQLGTSSPNTPVKGIVEKGSTRASTQPSLTQITSKTSSTVQVQQWTPLLTTSVTNIVESESRRTSTQPSLTQTTSKTSSTVQVQLGTSSTHTLLKDIVESESRRTTTQPSLIQTTIKTSSTAKVQLGTSSPTTSVKDILESESARTSTQPSLTQTTSQSSSTVQVQWRTSSPTTSVKDIVESESRRTTTQPSLIQTTIKTSSTAKVQLGTSSPTTSVKDNIIKIIAGVTFFGVAVGVSFLGWLFIKKESCFNKRYQGSG